MFSFIRLAIKLYMLSGMDCETLGIILRRRRQKAKIRVDKTTAKTINREEFVNEMSMPPALMGMNRFDDKLFHRVRHILLLLFFRAFDKAVNV